MNPVKKLEKKYPGTYATFLTVVGNPRTGRAKTLAAMLLRMDEVQDRYLAAFRKDQLAHEFEEVRTEYEEARNAFFELSRRISEEGYPANVYPILT